MHTAGKREAAPANGGFVFQSGKKHVSPCRGLRGQQAMIAAGVAAMNRAGCVIAAAVREKPFPAHGAGEVSLVGADTKFHK